MYENMTSVCRLCLKLCEEYEGIEEAHHNVLITILLNINLALSHEPVICKACLSSVQKCFNFTTSLNIDQRVNGFTGCLFCIQWVETDPFILLNLEQLDIMLFKAMLEQFFPDLDLNVLENPFVCLTCYECLQSNFNFLVRCLNVEQQIKKYSESMGTNDIGQVDLCQVVNYATIISIECNDEEESFKESDTSQIIEENFDMENIVIDEGTICIKRAMEEELVIPDCVNIEEILESADKEFVNEYTKCSTEIDAKTKKERAKIKAKSATKAVGIKSRTKTETQISNKVSKRDKNDCKEEKRVCGATSRKKRRFRINPARIKKDDVDDWWTNISFSNRNSFRPTVNSCGFKVNQRTNQIKRTNKNRWQKPLYKCTYCPFETPLKNRIRIHMVVHKDSVDVPKYECHTCGFIVYRKMDIVKHMDVHRPPRLDSIVYKCDKCSYITKTESRLECHRLKHIPKRVKILKCKVCQYETKFRSVMLRHQQRHAELVRCGFCSFGSKYAKSLRSHYSKMHNVDLPLEFLTCT